MIRSESKRSPLNTTALPRVPVLRLWLRKAEVEHLQSQSLSSQYADSTHTYYILIVYD